MGFAIANSLNFITNLIVFFHRLAFVVSYRLGGTLENYELTYNYQLKKVLNGLKIRSVDVVEEEFKGLNNRDKALYFVQKALDFYNKK